MRNEARKNEYFTGDLKEEIIERKESLRDLGVQLTDDGTFGEQIEKVCKKVAGCFELSTQETLNS